MSPEEVGLKGALRLKEIDLATARVEGALAAYNYAALKLQMEQIALVLARWSSETGKSAPGMNHPSFERWLKERT